VDGKEQWDKGGTLIRVCPCVLSCRRFTSHSSCFTIYLAYLSVSPFCIHVADCSCIDSPPDPPHAAPHSTTLPSHHPFTYTKPNPSQPHPTTRTPASTTPSTPSLDGPSPLSSPPTSYTNLSRRQSKFTAFSGSSSASSVRSSDSSIRNGHSHWGLGEKPDISTVFEEEGSINSFDQDVKMELASESGGPSAQVRERHL
jgi:hypothetical protein